MVYVIVIVDVEVISGWVGEDGEWGGVEVVGVGDYECFEIIEFGSN